MTLFDPNLGFDWTMGFKLVFNTAFVGCVRTPTKVQHPLLKLALAVEPSRLNDVETKCTFNHLFGLPVRSSL
jgi:hypothetical protein